MRLSLSSFGAGALTVTVVLAIVAVAHAETGQQVQPARNIDDPRPAPAGTRVALLGDSVAHVSTPALRERFAARGFDAPIVSGVPGIRADQRVVEGAVLVAPSTPDVLVLELGTNDVGAFLFDQTDMSASNRDRHARTVAENQLELANAVGPQLRCIVVVNVSANTLSPAANDVAHAENLALDAWARSDERVRVADWDSLVAHEFAQREPSGSMTTDLVHPTPYGATRLAALVEATIDTCKNR